MATPFAVPASGTYRIGFYTTQATTNYNAVGSTSSYIAGDTAVSSGVTATADSARNAAMGYIYVSSINNMTLVTAAQTANATVSNGRVLIEFDSTGTPTLNTDLTAEVTCNGGTNWAAASLSAATSNSQAARKVAETVDQACAVSGTSFAARIKTLNSKTAPTHGLSLTVH